MVGYRIDVHGEVLNVLRWSTNGSDARKRIPPGQFQPIPPFLGVNAPVVTKAEFAGSGFSLAGHPFVGYRRFDARGGGSSGWVSAGLRAGTGDGSP